MTEAEAIKTLEDFQRLLTNYRHISTELTEANGMAIKALEKQIAKKPIDRIAYSDCPCCGEVDIIGCLYCPVCGQHLNWEDSEV